MAPASPPPPCSARTCTDNSRLPRIELQGLLDGGAYVALFASSHAPHAEIAVVVASAFSAVTVSLARLFLREAMTWLQWLGIAMIVCGVAFLSLQS